MATAQPGDVALDALALIQAQPQGDAKAMMAILDLGDPEAICLQLTRMCAGLLSVRTDNALAALELLRIQAIAD